MASGGGILRDPDGKIVFAFFKYFGNFSILEAETLALLHGLRLCQEKGIFKVQVEVDSAILVLHVTIGVLGSRPHYIRLG